MFSFFFLLCFVSIRQLKSQLINKYKSQQIFNILINWNESDWVEQPSIALCQTSQQHKTFDTENALPCIKWNVTIIYLIA